MPGASPSFRSASPTFLSSILLISVHIITRFLSPVPHAVTSSRNALYQFTRNASVDYHEDPGTVLTVDTGRTVRLLPPLMEPMDSGADSEGLTRLPQGGRGSCGSPGWAPLTLTLMSRECFPEQVTTDLRLLTQWAPATLNNSQVLE